MTKFPHFASLLAIGALAFITAPRASATAELILSDGLGHTATVAATSCGATCESAVFFGALGNWNINIDAGIVDPNTAPLMDLSFNDTLGKSTNAAQTLTIEWAANGITPASSGFTLNIGGTVGSSGTVTAALYGGVNNTLADTTHQVGSTLSFSNPPAAFSGSTTAFLAGVSPSPYSLTQIITVSFAANKTGQSSGDYSVDVVPEPASVLLLGTVLLGAVSLIRRKVAAGKAV